MSSSGQIVIIIRSTAFSLIGVLISVIRATDLTHWQASRLEIPLHIKLPASRNMKYYSDNISVQKIRQWEKIINEMRLENTKLKNELSAAIRFEVSVDFLERAEYFQQRFIEEDQMIQLLRYDLTHISRQLLAKDFKVTNGKSYILMERDIAKLSAAFTQLKNSFLQFLSAS